MGALVVDPSAIFGLVLEDEAADYAAAVLAIIETSGAVVPSLFWYEVTNVLVVNERRGRIEPAKTTSFLSNLVELPFETVEPPTGLSFLHLAREHRLSAYDASYLDLARHRSLPLASLDRQLLAAAASAGLPVHETRS